MGSWQTVVWTTLNYLCLEVEGLKIRELLCVSVNRTMSWDHHCCLRDGITSCLEPSVAGNDSKYQQSHRSVCWILLLAAHQPFCQHRGRQAAVWLLDLAAGSPLDLIESYAPLLKEILFFVFNCNIWMSLVIRYGMDSFGVKMAIVRWNRFQSYLRLL